MPQIYVFIHRPFPLVVPDTEITEFGL